MRTMRFWYLIIWDYYLYVVEVDSIDDAFYADEHTW